jgi:hypothetical protein
VPLAGFANGAAMDASQVQQIINLLTGVMTDQPVTINNSGSALPLTIKGLTGTATAEQGLIRAGIAGTTKDILIGYDNVADYGYVAAINHGVAWKTLYLNPIQGLVQIGPGGLTVGGAVAITGALSGVTSLAMSAALSGATDISGATLSSTGKASLTNQRATSFVGAWSTVGAPAGLTGAIGDWGYDKNNRKWVCAAAGSPGTWIDPIAYYSSDYTINTTPAIGAATYTLVKFATSEGGGDPSGSYSGTTGLYTAQIAGTFMVTCYMAVANSGGTIGGYIAKNATAYHYLPFAPASRIGFSLAVPLAVGDTVSGYVWCTGATTVDNTLVPFLQVQYLG